MTSYELARLVATPFLPVLEGKVRWDLTRLLQDTPAKPARLLDVGGRKSPYTIGLPALVTILDIPRENALQRTLNLGLNRELCSDLQHGRSNIENVHLQRMEECDLPSASFDGVICVETIEHVREDGAFVRQIARVLKSGGWAYFSTPNGDYVKNEGQSYNPDHVRHYGRDQLAHLLAQSFERIEIWYGVRTGKYRFRGLRSFNFARPYQTLQSMVCNVINRFESRDVCQQSRRTAHLFAIAWKPNV